MRKHIQRSSNLQFSTIRTFQSWRSVTYWIILTLFKLRRHATRFAWLPRLPWIMGTVEGVANTTKSVRKSARAWLRYGEKGTPNSDPPYASLDRSR